MAYYRLVWDTAYGCMIRNFRKRSTFMRFVKALPGWVLSDWYPYKITKDAMHGGKWEKTKNGHTVVFAEAK